MILPWMAYLCVVTLLLGAAAHVLESAIRQRGLPVRWLWVGAIVGSIVLTVSAAALAFFSDPQPRNPPPLSSVPTRQPLASTIELIRPLTTTPTYLRNPNFDAWGVGVWVFASLVVAAVLLVSYKGILRRWDAWKRADVDGDSVWISSDVGPAVVGYFPSHIVLPIWLLGSPREDRGLVLNHEKEHIRAGDPRLVLASWVLLVMLPWNLALWWVCRRLRQAVEIDCDLRLVKHGIDVRRYSLLLMEVTDRGVSTRLAVSALSETRSLLERRVGHLMASPAGGWWRRAVGPLAAATLLVASACYLEHPVGALRDRLTLWVAPSGTLHLDDFGGPAISLAELDGALRDAVSNTMQGSVLDLRGLPGGYEYALIRRAVCGAGISTMLVDLDGPQGPEDVSVINACTTIPSLATPDTASLATRSGN